MVVADRGPAPLTVVAILRGHACVVPEGGEMMRLEAGDVAIARGPEPYLVADDPDTPVQAVIHPGGECRTPEGVEVKMMDFVGVRSWGNAVDGETIMMCGTYPLEGEVPARLLRALPQMLVLDQRRSARRSSRCWPTRSSRTPRARKRCWTGCWTCC